jgi:hypothetical protein
MFDLVLNNMKATTDLEKLGCNTLLKTYYHNSIATALSTLYPEFKWHIWLFFHEELSESHWDDIMNRKEYLDWLLRQLQPNGNMESWYRFSNDEIISNRGDGILKRYGYNLWKLLEATYQEVKWQPWRFVHNKVPYGYWNDNGRREEYFSWLSNMLEIRNPDHWYEITSNDVEYHGGMGLLQYYSNSLCKALSSTYPEWQWLPWRFDKLPNDYWKKKENVLEFFHWLGEKLGIKQPVQWTNISKKEIEFYGGTSLLANFGNSHIKALQFVYPTIPWLTQQYMIVPSRYWNDHNKHRAFFDWIADNLNITNYQQWYDITRSDIDELGGQGLLEYYDGLPYKALQSVYPEFEWHPWRFKRSPGESFWKDKVNQRKFFDWLANEMGITRPQGWHAVNKNIIYKYGGKTLLQLYDNSVQKAILSVYPELRNILKYLGVPSEFWEDIQSQKDFIKWLTKQLNIDDQNIHPPDWYENLTKKAVVENGGEDLLKLYGGSLGKLLQSTYPHIEWDLWKFDLSKEEYNDHGKLILELAKKLNITKYEDWYGVTHHQLKLHVKDQLTSLLASYGGSLLDMLRAHYPQFNWNVNKWKLLSTSRSQQSLFHAISNLLNDTSIEKEYRIPIVRYRNKHSMQLDIWLPKYNIAIEYQGPHHYMDNNFLSGEWGVLKQYQRDKEKKLECMAIDITLLYFPFWWSYDTDTVASVLKQVSLLSTYS